MALRVSLVLIASCLASVEGYCSSYTFECYYSGWCIPYSYICDGNYDCCDAYTCLDTTDEDNCDSCYNQYRCSNGYCISHSKGCDGYNDCYDNSDEYNCSSSDSSSVTGLVVGLTVLILFLIVVVIICTVGGGSYRRSRRRRRMRTVPLMTVHPPPVVASNITTTHVPPPEQLPASSINYPAQPHSTDKDYPPPYSAVERETALETKMSRYPPPANPGYPQLSPTASPHNTTSTTSCNYPAGTYAQPPPPPPPNTDGFIAPCPPASVPPASVEGVWPAPATPPQ